MKAKPQKYLIMVMMMLLFCASMFLQSFVPCNPTYAAWDGYVEEENEIVSIAKLDDMASIISYGGGPSSEHTVNHAYSMRWNNHLTNTRLTIPVNTSLKNKLSYGKELKMWIYSKKATGSIIKCVFTCPTTSAGGNYFHKDFTVDWEGMKEIVIPLAKMDIARSPAWHNVYQFRMVAHGDWSMVGNSETDLYIAGLDIKLRNPSNTLDILYESDTIDETYAALESSAAFYAGGTNAATSLGSVAIDGKVGYVDKKVMIPVSVFASAFDAEVSDSNSKFSVTFNSSVLSGTAGSAYADFNGTSVTFESTPYFENGKTYIPGAQCANLFGLKSYEDGKFLVIGTVKATQAMQRKGKIGVNEKMEIASYMSYHTDKSSVSYTDDDFSLFIEKWRRNLVGSEELNDLTDPNIKYAVDMNESKAKTSYSKLIRTENSDSIFTDIKIKSTSDMTSVYTHLKNMAVGYGTYGTSIYKNETLCNDIIYALDWMYENYYGINEINGTGWKPEGLDNWWDWDIGSPERLIDILMIMYDDLDEEQIKKYLAYFDAKNSRPRSSGSNYVNIDVEILCSGVLQKNSQKVQTALQYFEKMYLYADDNKRSVEWRLDQTGRAEIVPVKGSGFFTDGSYVYHTLHPMNGTYGRDHFCVLAEVEALLGGTVFEIDNPQRNNIVEFFFNNMDTAVFGGTTLYRMYLGRDSTLLNNYDSGIEIYTKALECADSFEPEIRDEIYSIVKGAYLLNPTNSFYRKLTIEGIHKLNKIIADSDIIARTDRYMNKVFYNQDTVVHQSGEWSVGIQMSSARMFNYESINDENLDGWYLGDGRTEYYVKGSKDGANKEYWERIDKYRLPGTTIDTQERQKISINQGNEYLSSKDFVGGVTLGGTYGVAAMELESYHAEVPIGVDGLHGYANPVHKNDLTAKKGYFMFDDCIVCLGSDVNATDNNNAEVLTIVDNRMATSVQLLGSGDSSEPYVIKSAVANITPEVAHIASNTIDSDMTTKWTSEEGGEIIWDLGEVKNCGFIALSFQNGAKRQQYFELHLSSDGNLWNKVFDDGSSGTTDTMECFELGGLDARYVKFVNKGNSVAGNTWVSLTDCKIYPLNPDGSTGILMAEIYGGDSFVVDGNNVNLTGDDYELQNAKWANIGNKVGYYFPDDDSENPAKLKARWTKNSSSFFELWFSHGVNPVSSSYAYALLPGKDVAYTKQFAEASPVHILSNNSSVQAVYHETLGIYGIIFWKAGTFGEITVDKPCIVMYKDAVETFSISVSEPTQKLDCINVSIDGVMTAQSMDECASLASDAEKTYISIDTQGSLGRTIESVLKKN